MFIMMKMMIMIVVIVLCLLKNTVDEYNDKNNLNDHVLVFDGLKSVNIQEKRRVRIAS